SVGPRNVPPGVLARVPPARAAYATDPRTLPQVAGPAGKPPPGLPAVFFAYAWSDGWPAGRSRPEPVNRQQATGNRQRTGNGQLGASWIAGIAHCPSVACCLLPVACSPVSSSALGMMQPANGADPHGRQLAALAGSSSVSLPVGDGHRREMGRAARAHARIRRV